MLVTMLFLSIMAVKLPTFVNPLRFKDVILEMSVILRIYRKMEEEGTVEVNNVDTFCDSLVDIKIKLCFTLKGYNINSAGITIFCLNR